MSTVPSTPPAAAPATAAPPSSGPTRTFRQRDLQQSSLGYFIGGNGSVRFSDCSDPQQCRASGCGSMCLYAAPVCLDDLGTLAKFIDDGERHLHLCVGCAIQGLEANELEGAELSDNDATALSMIVGASGMDSVNKDDYTNEIINPIRLHRAVPRRRIPRPPQRQLMNPGDPGNPGRGPMWSLHIPTTGPLAGIRLLCASPQGGISPAPLRTNRRDQLCVPTPISWMKLL